MSRARVVLGRRAVPTARDEVLVSKETAERLHLGPGDRLTVQLLGSSDCSESPRGATLGVEIVGIHFSPGEVAPPSGPFTQTVLVTPALVHSLAQADHQDYLAVRLRRGTTVETLEDEARAAGYSIFVVASRAENEDAVDRAIRPTAVALGILAILTAFAGIAVLGQLLVRFAAGASPDEAVLAAIGMSRRTRFILGMLRAATVALVAIPVAVATAYIASRAMPVGVARGIEPARRFEFDVLVLGLGALGIFLFVVAITAIPTWRVTSRALHDSDDQAAARSRVADAAARAGFPPAATAGARLALERGAGTNAVPVVSSFAGLAIAVAAVVGAVTFAAGMDHVRSTARLLGWNWDAIIEVPNTENAQPPVSSAVAHARVDRVLGAHPDVVSYATGSFFGPFVGGNPMLVGPKETEVDPPLAFDGDAPVGPSVISGRKPSAANEILLGPASLAEVGVGIGDEVDVVSPGTWTDPNTKVTVRMRVVGTGTIPLSQRLGKGSAMTTEGLARLAPGFQASAIYVRLAPHADVARIHASLARAFPEADRSGEDDEFVAGDLPDPALNLEQVDAAPWLFAAEMGLIAAAVLAYVLFTATRARRRDLALLRVFGFSHAQTERSVAYQSVVYATGALIVGCPLGFALGRFAWRRYAESLGVVPEAVTPWTAIGIIAVVALVTALLLSIVPGRRAARRRIVDLLRAE
jgi:ABC-type lipoprotein release transport system permease subunit